MNQKRGVLLLALLLLLTACRGLGQTPPPPPFSPESLATALALTENAPPPGLETASFPQVDLGLKDLPGYRYVLELRFEGTYDHNLQPVGGTIRAEVWWDGNAPARRVVLAVEGEAFAAEASRVEAVRIVDDYYVLAGAGRCLVNPDEALRAVADLDAGALIGGVTAAPYGGVKAILNGEQAYRYEVSATMANLPAIHQRAGNPFGMVGELWVAPQAGVVVRYYANADVAGVRLLDSTETVSGQLYIRYDVFDLGVVPNISIPYGC
ncbi:MAG: hypothetical protein HPY64_17195 [Anaerolineae bacterium]|nr:hypothetical protein [Anaerolineae bacterium]